MNNNPKGIIGIMNPKPEPIRHTIIINSICKNCNNKWIDTIELTIKKPRNEPCEHLWDYCSECFPEKEAK